MNSTILHLQRRRRPAARALTLAAGLLALLAARGLVAQSVPADAVLRDFKPDDDYVLEIDGQTQNGEVLRSDRVPAFMVINSQLAQPTLLLPREGTVDTVSIMKLARRADGTVDILADAELQSVGRFTFDSGGENILFSVDGHKVALRQKPYLLGLQDLQSVLAYSSGYRTSAAAYKPDAQAVAALRADAQSARVRVYFGSWCPHCKHFLPFMLRVAEELKGSKLQFEFYGLPSPFDKEPQAVAEGIRGVPTGIVYVGGKEVGRIEGNKDWDSPEKALVQVLDHAGG
jgi:thiol-disulfide isomerase/thioredoxin